MCNLECCYEACDLEFCLCCGQPSAAAPKRNISDINVEQPEKINNHSSNIASRDRILKILMHSINLNNFNI